MTKRKREKGREHSNVSGESMRGYVVWLLRAIALPPTPTGPAPVLLSDLVIRRHVHVRSAVRLFSRRHASPAGSMVTPESQQVPQILRAGTGRRTALRHAKHAAGASDDGSLVAMEGHVRERCRSSPANASFSSFWLMRQTSINDGDLSLLTFLFICNRLVGDCSKERTVASRLEDRRYRSRFNFWQYLGVLLWSTWS